MINPVIWIQGNVDIEVKIFSLTIFIKKNWIYLFEEQTATTIVYSVTLASPTSGWEGFYIQVNFPGIDDTALELTTETQIIPDTYPTSDCHGDTCYGTLVWSKTERQAKRWDFFFFI